MRKHNTIHWIQVGANALPDRLLPQMLKKVNTGHCRTLPKRSGQDLLERIFNTFQSFIQRHNRIFEVRVSFLPRMLSSRTGSQHCSPAPLAAFIFERAFAFWASCGFLTPQPCSFLCKHRITLLSLLLRCLKITLGRKACQSASSKGFFLFLSFFLLIFLYFHLFFFCLCHFVIVSIFLFFFHVFSFVAVAAGVAFALAVAVAVAVVVVVRKRHSHMCLSKRGRT